jgi:hypothetical protein
MDLLRRLRRHPSSTAPVPTKPTPTKPERATPRKPPATSAPPEIERPREDLEARAEARILAHLESQSALVERAARLREKARRLEDSGTPSETAHNRAARAREELDASLAALGKSFVRAYSGEGGDAAEAEGAFSRAASRLYPGFS